jgi:hypothetical protein
MKNYRSHLRLVQREVKAPRKQVAEVHRKQVVEVHRRAI